MEITLALGGGGAKGNAHIGVLRVLDREGFKIRAIAGTSIGGLIGAVYAAGYSPEEILRVIKEIDQNKLYGRKSGDQPAILGLAGVTKLLVKFIGDRTFGDLRFPFAVTAVDLNSGKSIVLDSGPVLDAVLATVALPGIFPARQWENMLLVDGGVSNPVPVDVVRSLAPGYPIVAVVLSRVSETRLDLNIPKIPGPSGVVSYLSRLRVTQALGVFAHSLEISSRVLTELRLEIDKPDVIISPDLTGIGLLDRVDAEEVAKLGEEAAEASLAELRKVVGWRFILTKFFGIPRLGKRFKEGEIHES